MGSFQPCECCSMNKLGEDQKKCIRFSNIELINEFNKCSSCWEGKHLSAKCIRSIYVNSKPEACKRWLLYPFSPAFSCRSNHRSFPEKHLLPSISSSTVSSRHNGSILHMDEILQCSIPSEWSRVFGISESSTTKINQVYFLQRKNNSCIKKSKPLYPKSDLEFESPGMVLFRRPSWKCWNIS